MRSLLFATAFACCVIISVPACASDTSGGTEFPLEAEGSDFTGYWQQVEGSSGASISRLRLNQTGSSFSGDLKAIFNVRFERDIEGSIVGDTLFFSIPSSDGTTLLKGRGLLSAGDSLFLSVVTPGQFGGEFSSVLVRQDV